VSLVTLLVAIAALGIARGQLKNIVTTGRAESFKMVLAPLDDPEIRLTRYLVLREDWPPKLPPTNTFDGVDDIERRVRQLGYAYDTLAIFVLKDLIEADFVFEIHGESVVVIWHKLSSFPTQRAKPTPKVRPLLGDAGEPLGTADRGQW
jgi:hypothetical protein